MHSRYSVNIYYIKIHEFLSTEKIGYSPRCKKKNAHVKLNAIVFNNNAITIFLILDYSINSHGMVLYSIAGCCR